MYLLKHDSMTKNEREFSDLIRQNVRFAHDVSGLLNSEGNSQTTARARSLFLCLEPDPFLSVEWQ